MTKKIGIYCYTNKINGKKYIGQSIDLDRRHRKMAYRNSSMFSAAVAKYGLENFEYEVLELCKAEELDEKEIYWISFYQTFPPSLGFGYNLTSGGGHFEVSDETRKKLSEKQRGEKHWTAVWKSLGKQINLSKGSLTEEHKRKISESKRGEKHPLFGKHLPPEWLENKRKGMLGKQNTLGQKNQPNASSKYHGVRLRKDRGNWTVEVKYRNVKYYVGSSRDEETAARLYDAYVREHNLPHPLNFPDNNTKRLVESEYELKDE